MKPWVHGMILLAVCPLLVAQEGIDKKRVRELVDRLEDDDPVEREEAQGKLLKMGKDIAPLLEKLAEDAPLETASRIRYILRRYERDEHLSKSLPPYKSVTIEHGVHTLKEIFDEISRQTGIKVESSGVEPEEKIEAGWDAAPALKVLDDVCYERGKGRVEASELLATHSRMRFGRQTNRTSDLNRLVVDGGGELVTALSHWERFRAAIKDVVITETRSYEKTSTKAEIVTDVRCQPGLKPIHVGNIEIVEVVDDRGKSLKKKPDQNHHFYGYTPPEPGEETDVVWLAWGSYYGGERGRLEIEPPSEGAKRLAKLRFKFRLAFGMKEVDRTIKVEEISRTGVIKVGPGEIKVTRAETVDGKFHIDCEMKGAFRGSPNFGLIDAEGKEISTRGGSYSSGSKSSKITLTLSRSVEVDAVRFRAWIGHYAFEVPFEFEDVPFPKKEAR